MCRANDRNFDKSSRKTADSVKRLWDGDIATILTAYRNRRHSDGDSAYYFVFGIPCRWVPPFIPVMGKWSNEVPVEDVRASELAWAIALQSGRIRGSGEETVAYSADGWAMVTAKSAKFTPI